MIWYADLHLHSCLSPCAGLDMSPRAIAQIALARGLHALALTDHNSARNAPAMQEACEAAGLACLHGLEVNTVEEAHVLCYFDRLEAAMELDRMIMDRLPDVRHDPERFGDQLIVNVEEDVLGSVEKYLLSGAGITLRELVDVVHAEGGLVIPSHVDRDAFSLTSQLGFIPEEPFDAVEITPYYDWRSDPLRLHGRYAMLMNSDAHSLERVGARCSRFEVEAFDVPSLREFLAGRRGCLGAYCPSLGSGR